MRCLVTGGAGFIGSHIVDGLTRAGHDVVVLDDLSNGCRANLRDSLSRIRFVEGDIRDRSGVREAMKGVEVVIHCAAMASAAGSISDPVGSDSVNVGGTVVVLTEASEAGVRAVVLASSSAVYGDHGAGPLSESTEPNPLSPYALQKLTAERYLALFHRLHGLGGVVLRYFNVYGPRQDGTSEYGGVISVFRERFLRAEPPTVFGDGLQTRDFVHVDDVVVANMAAVEARLDRVPVINVGGGRACTLLDLLAQFNRLSGCELPARFAAARPGEIRHSRADITALRSVLGVTPKTTLESGLGQLWHAQEAV